MAVREDPGVLVWQDARVAVHALVDLVNRHPFAMGPITAPFEPEDLLPPVHPDQLVLIDS